MVAEAVIRNLVIVRSRREGAVDEGQLMTLRGPSLGAQPDLETGLDICNYLSRRYFYVNQRVGFFKGFESWISTLG